MSEQRISELAIYPVKSLAGLALPRVRVDHFGLHNDRRWMVVDGDGRYLTQRQHPRLCLVQAEAIEGGLRLTAPDAPALWVQACPDDARRPVTVWEDHCSAVDCGDEAARWLGRFLDIDCRLVFFPDDERRPVDPAFARPGDLTAFSDGFPLLLISQASLDDLNARLAEPVPMHRFRPNLVVTGSGPYAEDGWRRLRIGGLTLRVVKPCSRCVIPTIDTASGQRHPEAEPLRTLGDYRRRDNKIYFGQNVIADGEGVLEAGMPVEVLA